MRSRVADAPPPFCEGTVLWTSAAATVVVIYGACTTRITARAASGEALTCAVRPPQRS